MRRWLLALVGLVGLTPGLARADYLILVINLGQARLPMPAQSGAGMMGMGGQTGGPGPGRGAMGTGMFGFSLVGGPTPGGMGGMGGMGAQGMRGMGAQGMRGGMGVMGVPAPPSSAIQLVPVCIEVDRVPDLRLLKTFYNPPANTALYPLRVTHKWGTAQLLCTTGPVIRTHFVMNKDGKTFPKALTRFNEYYAKVLRNGPKVQDKLNAAEVALSLGLFEKFKEIMDFLAKDEKSTLAVANYIKIKEELKKSVDRVPVASWYSKLSQQGYNSKTHSAHYIILHKNFLGDDLDRVKARLTRLEENLRDYYYWWALHGKALPMPKEKLVVVVTASRDEFKYFHNGLSGSPVVWDGFHSIVPNVTVLALNPTTERYSELKRLQRALLAQGGVACQCPEGLQPGARLPGKGRRECDGPGPQGDGRNLRGGQHQPQRQPATALCVRRGPGQRQLARVAAVRPEQRLRDHAGNPLEDDGAANPIYMHHFTELSKTKEEGASDYWLCARWSPTVYSGKRPANPAIAKWPAKRGPPPGRSATIWPAGSRPSCRTISRSWPACRATSIWTRKSCSPASPVPWMPGTASAPRSIPRPWTAWPVTGFPT